MWKIRPTDAFKRRRRQFEKNHPRELQAVETNLHRYLEALNLNAKPAQIQGGWIHHEPMGVVAIDQRGGGKKQGGKNLGKGLRETRLYVLPVLATEILHIITLGDKQTQSDDIYYASQYAQEIARDSPTALEGEA